MEKTFADLRKWWQFKILRSLSKWKQICGGPNDGRGGIGRATAEHFQMSSQRVQWPQYLRIWLQYQKDGNKVSGPCWEESSEQIFSPGWKNIFPSFPSFARRSSSFICSVDYSMCLLLWLATYNPRLLSDFFIGNLMASSSWISVIRNSFGKMK